MLILIHNIEYFKIFKILEIRISHQLLDNSIEILLFNKKMYQFFRNEIFFKKNIWQCLC